MTLTLSGIGGDEEGMRRRKKGVRKKRGNRTGWKNPDRCLTRMRGLACIYQSEIGYWMRRVTPLACISTLCIYSAFTLSCHRVVGCVCSAARPPHSLNARLQIPNITTPRPSWQLCLDDRGYDSKHRSGHAWMTALVSSLPLQVFVFPTAFHYSLFADGEGWTRMSLVASQR